jgi:hypothetical protein
VGRSVFITIYNNITITFIIPFEIDNIPLAVCVHPLRDDDVLLEVENNMEVTAGLGSSCNNEYMWPELNGMVGMSRAWKKLTATKGSTRRCPYKEM